jgi:hypothetical protein
MTSSEELIWHRGSCGPVQERLLTLLCSYSSAPFLTSIAERSPIGPCVIRVTWRHGEDASSARESDVLVRWLRRQREIGAAAAKPPHVYVRPTLDVARVWATACVVSADMRATDDNLVMGARGVERSWSDEMTDCRRAATLDSIAEVLHVRGRGTGNARAPAPGREGTYSSHGASSDRTKIAETATLHVGAVDIRKGAWRATHGGSVTATDAQADARAWLGMHYGDFGAEACEAFLRFVFVSTMRRRRLVLDSIKLLNDAVAFDGILGMRRMASAKLESDAGVDGSVSGESVRAEQAMYALVVALDRLPQALSEAAAELEPATMSRMLRNLIRRAYAARDFLGVNDPLWRLIDGAIEVILRLLSIDVPRQMWGDERAGLLWRHVVHHQSTPAASYGNYVWPRSPFGLADDRWDVAERTDLLK